KPPIQWLDIRRKYVVSESRENFGGVVQFDRSKSTTSGFVETGYLNTPPHILAGNIEKLKAVHNLHGNNILHFLDEMLAKYPRMTKKYGYPGADEDRLFTASYTHQDGDIAQIVNRGERSDPHPQVHYGTIGSSNMVVEDTKTRDKLRDIMGILCVEMEAAGLMEAFPCLVVRGISDYADSHKNKKWQLYAAATAAAYTKELLLQIPPDAVTHTKSITEALRGLSTKIDEVERRTHSAEEMAILEWLSPKDVDFSSLQNTSQSTHTPGSGGWLLNDERYRAWRDGEPGLLWLHGAGKLPAKLQIVLANCDQPAAARRSMIIRNLQEHTRDKPTRRLAYWYFRFDNSTSQNVSRILRSIIRQLSTSRLSFEVQALRDQHSRAGSEPSVEELTKALVHTLQSLEGEIYIVFDALDECPGPDKQGQRDQLLRCIKSLVSETRPNLHILVTSRPEPDIRREVGRIANYALDIEELVKEDVARYVETALAKPDLASWDEQAKGRIRDKLLSFEERRFRWADLQIKRFAQCATSGGLEDALKTIEELVIR
ncbi:hypothetical protein PG994_007345, partial [Apiospora phragmitis]